MSNPIHIYIVMVMNDGENAMPMRAFRHKCDARRYSVMLERCETYEGCFDTIWIDEVIYHE